MKQPPLRAWLRSILRRGVLGASVLALPACLAGDPPRLEILRTSGAIGLPQLEEPALLPPPRTPEPRAETRQVIVVAMDGVRWQEIFEGVDPALAREHGIAAADVVDAARLLPNLHAAIDRGVALGAPDHGAPIVASGPNFASLPGYLEMLSGRPSASCERNDCPPTKHRTLLDECRAMRDVGPDDVAMVSSWENLERAASVDPSRIVVSAGRHHGKSRDRLRRDPEASRLLDLGAKSMPSPGQEDYRADRFTAPLALSYLVSARPRCLFVGLGDPDEHAHLSDYRGYLTSLRYLDSVVGRIFDSLASMGEYGATTSVWITADHGRADDFAHHGRKAPESARVWLIAAGGAVPRLGLVAATETRRLSDVAPSLRVLLGLRPDDSASAGRPMWEILPPDAEAATLRSASLHP